MRVIYLKDSTDTILPEKDTLYGIIIDSEETAIQRISLIQEIKKKGGQTFAVILTDDLVKAFGYFKALHENCNNIIFLTDKMPSELTAQVFMAKIKQTKTNARLSINENIKKQARQ